MSPTGKRRFANALIYAGVLPLALWLAILGVLLIHGREGLAPWVSAGLFFLGIVVYALSPAIAAPSMIWLHRMQRRSDAPWPLVQRFPFFVGALLLFLASAYFVWWVALWFFGHGNEA